MMTKSQSAETEVGAAALAPPLSRIDFGRGMCCSPSARGGGSLRPTKKTGHEGFQIFRLSKEHSTCKRR